MTTTFNHYNWCSIALTSPDRDIMGFNYDYGRILTDNIIKGDLIERWGAFVL